MASCGYEKVVRLWHPDRGVRMPQLRDVLPLFNRGLDRFKEHRRVIRRTFDQD